jgi:hypothetical protein
VGFQEILFVIVEAEGGAPIVDCISVALAFVLAALAQRKA